MTVPSSAQSFFPPNTDPVRSSAEQSNKLVTAFRRTMAVACALRRALGASTHTRLRSPSHLTSYHQNQHIFSGPTWTHNVALCRDAAFSRRSLSTQTFPPSKSSRARVVSARELYAQRNRSLFMYTSAVVRPRFGLYRIRNAFPN